METTYTTKGESKARIRLILLAVLFYTLTVFCVDAAVLGAGTQLGASDGSGYYTIEGWNVSFTTLTINSSQINISGMDEGMDVYNVTSQVFHAQDVNETIFTATNTNETVRIADLLSYTSNITYINLTSNFSTATVCYNTTGVGNITLLMDADSNSRCFYKASNTAYIYYNRSSSTMADCTLILQTNATSGSYCSTVEPDLSVNETNITSIVAVGAVTIIGVIAAMAWTTKSE